MIKGFTLIELLITLAIFGLLAAIAYPTYSQHVVKARRSDAQIALLDLAARMERFYAISNSYQGATLAKLHINATTSQGFYTLVIAQAASSTFLLAAKPLGAQAINDPLCGELTINQLGQKSQTGTGTMQQCWG